ncbi:MAG: MFS transporter [Gemmatimonadetes bacterium]|jgi:nucleoside transporter|nr:MFS transporter [Gemmatimonadota bacterium]
MSGIRTRLSIMMFLQFFVWGAWYTTIAVFMQNQGMETLTHWPFTVNPVAAIVAPFFVGLIADRFFATERVFGLLHLIGGLLLLIAPRTTGNPTLFIVILLLYNLCYMPTLGLSSSLGFHHIADQEKDFPKIRVWGTIGWIIAGLFISFVLSKFVSGGQAEKTSLPLYSAAIASLVLAAFSFGLPHTPAPARGQAVSARSIIGIDAFKQLGSTSFYVFVASALLICIPLAAYYNFTQLFLEAAKVKNIAATQTLGQMSEMLFMLAMPVLFARWGVKKMLLAGMGAWVLRYALFAAAAPTAVYWMIALGILLHGICYDFFFVTGQIYVDKKSTPAIRGQAQGFFVFVTYGVGMLIGAQVAGNVYNRFLAGAPALALEQWKSFWILPSVFAAVILVFFGLAFHDREAEVKRRESIRGAAAEAPTPAGP